MKIFSRTVSLFAIILNVVGCSTSNHHSESSVRQPQSSEYQEAEVLSDDGMNADAEEIVENHNEGKTHLSILNKICIETGSAQIQVKDRVVTMNNGKYISGDIKKSFENDSAFIVLSNTGYDRASVKSLILERKKQDVSKALVCQGTKSKKMYGIFKIENKFMTGQVKDVFKNGVVRFYNDRLQEFFTTIDQAQLEIVGSKFKFKQVLFKDGDKELKGQIRRVFERKLVLISSGNNLMLRTLDEIRLEEK